MSTTESNAEKNESDGRLRLIGAAYLIVYICALNSPCTQFIAYCVAYHPTLSAPLFAYVYSPFTWWDRMFKFYGYTPGSCNYTLIFFALRILVGMLAYVLWVGSKSRNSHKRDNVRDTTHFATREEVQEAGLLPRESRTGQGVYCGAYDDAGTDKTFYLRHDDPEHVLALVPTRSGKGVGLIIPTLLSWPHSVFVLDRKDEDCAMTSDQRQKHANNVILRFDLTKPGIDCAWNPLGEIQYRTRFQISDTQSIATMVVGSGGKGIESNHFRSAAFELLVGLTLHVLYKGDQVGRTPCLQDIGHILTGVGNFAAPDTANDLANSPDGDPKALAGLFNEMHEVYTNDGGPANREAQIVITGVNTRMTDTPAHELGSIISTASNTFALYRGPIVGENTSRSDFKIVDLMDHDRPVSLYFVLTPRTPKCLAPLTRLLLTITVLTMTDEMGFDDGRAKAAYRHRLLLMLNGFPTLDKIEVFKGALAYIAGYGMKAYVITRDMSQLYKACTHEESIISNCHVRVAYAPNKLKTAEWMSKMTGNATMVKEQMTTSGERFGAVLDNMSRSYQEVKRPLMKSDEIMHLPKPTKDASGEEVMEADEMLVFVAGHSVIHGRQILYFADPVFSKRSGLKPVPIDVVHKVPGQPVTIALAPEDEAINRHGGLIVS